MVGPEIDVKLLVILGNIPEETESSTLMPRKSQFMHTPIFNFCMTKSKQFN